MTHTAPTQALIEQMRLALLHFYRKAGMTAAEPQILSASAEEILEAYNEMYEALK